MNSCVSGCFEWLDDLSGGMSGWADEWTASVGFNGGRRSRNNEQGGAGLGLVRQNRTAGSKKVFVV